MTTAANIDLDRLAADVVASLEARGVQRHGDELRFRCLMPEHEDHTASADYNINKMAWKCQSCGASGGLLVGDHPIAQLLGLDPADYRRSAGEPLYQRPHRKDMDSPTLSWEIRDADGHVVAVHHRRDLPDGSKKVWWSRDGKLGLNNLRVADLPLYGAHLLGDREPGDDSPVFLVEGEKATDALLERGLTAVGTVTGAASIPGTEALSVLKGRNVVCWPDNDRAGRQHMKKIAAIIDAWCTSVRIFAPAGLPEGGDAVEWLAAEGDGDSMTQLLEAVEVEAREAERETEPDTSTPEDGDHDLTHDGLALELGDLWLDDGRHVAKWGTWFFWSGSHWETDDSLLHMTRSRGFLRERAKALEEWAERKAEKLGAADAESLKKWAKKKAETLKNAHTVAQVVGLARSNQAQAASVGQWDVNHWLLGTPGGTVDLRTGELRDPRPEDYITKSTATEPAPPRTLAPLWTEFLDRITRQDGELIAYLQRWCGYSLTGSVQEHAFVFGHGTGANGKSVFTATMQGILGGYALTIATEVLMVSQTERHPTELARLRGVRLAVGSEIEVGKRWAEARVKALTGGDRIAARLMRQDFFEFAPTFKLFIVGNHRPSLYGVDDAIRRRLHLVPFNVKIPEAEQDKELQGKLRNEWPGILRWAIDGCLEWQQRGLDPPESVVMATNEYLEGEDAVGRWLDECTIADSNAWVSASALFESWKAWAEAGKEWVGSKKNLGEALQDREYKRARQGTDNARGYRGLQLREPRIRTS